MHTLAIYIIDLSSTILKRVFGCESTTGSIDL